MDQERDFADTQAEPEAGETEQADPETTPNTGDDEAADAPQAEHFDGMGVASGDDAE